MQKCPKFRRITNVVFVHLFLPAPSPPPSLCVCTAPTGYGNVQNSAGSHVSSLLIYSYPLHLCHLLPAGVQLPPNGGSLLVRRVQLKAMAIVTLSLSLCIGIAIFIVIVIGIVIGNWHCHWQLPIVNCHFHWHLTLSLVIVNCHFIVIVNCQLSIVTVTVIVIVNCHCQLSLSIVIGKILYLCENVQERFIITDSPHSKHCPS